MACQEHTDEAGKDRPDTFGCEPLDDLLDQVTAHLSEQSSLPDREVTALSISLVDRISKRWAGLQFYFPKILNADMEERNRQLLSEFDGHNHRELARKYQLSIQTIYRLVGKMSRQNPPTRGASQ